MAPTVEEKQRLLAEDEGVEPVVKKSYGSSTHESSGSSSDVSIEGKEKEKEKLKPASFGKLFRYATKFDVLLILVGTLFAIAHGAAFPMLMVVFGDMTDTFIMNSTSGAFNEEMTKFTLQYVYIGAGCFVASYIQIACWMSACERQVLKLRKTFFFCILRQEIGWFDQNPSGELSTRLVDDIERVREGLGDKFSQCIQFLAQFVAGFAFGFWKGWKMALVMMSLTPLLAVASAFMSKVIASYSTREQQAYAAAGSVAEEVLSSIRTVVSFRGQKKEIRRYNKELETSSKLGVKKSVVTGLGMGLTFLILYGAYALAFWYGATLIEVFYNTLGKDGMSPGSALTVFFCIMIGSFSIGNAAPHLASVATAKGAAATLYKVIDNIPIIDASSNDGIKIPDVKGNIEFCDVKFAYPSRPDVKILKGLSFTVPSGRTVALVGSSGCGKSTAVNLIQRFYDPEEGRILLDGNDLKNVNTRWLRQNIGVVSQEPILFGCSIIDNIRYGRLDVTYEEIIRAAKDANAHDFINRLPDGYDTLVGERGIQLSGGQKQRVAIARALVRDPKILLLDEATSALDAESEAVVQAALDKAREGRTTVVIAHRLSTIQSADQICVVQEGQVMEQGGHRELMNKEGLYYQLVTLQKLTRGDEESDKEEDGGEEGGVKEGERPRTPGLMRSKSLHRSHSKQTPGVLRQTSVKKKKTVEEEAKEEEVVLPGFCRILRLNKPEACHIVTGCIGGALVGGVMPAFAFFYGELIAAYTKTGETLLRESTFWSMMFLALGGVSFIGVLVNSYSFGVSGEKLTKRLRLKTFDNILRQDIAWFDDPRQATGALTTRLATDASLVKTGTGVRLGIIVQSAVSMIGGLTIAFIYGWALALLVLGTVPLMAVAGALNMKAISGRDKKDNEALEQAGKTASEAIENIRTVQSLTREPTFYDGYCNKLLQPFRENLKQAQFYGIAYGFSQGIIFFIYAGTFRFGAYLVDIGMMDPPDVYKVIFAIAFTGLAVGQAASFLPDYSKARLATGRIYKLMDVRPSIDSYSKKGTRLERVTGDITIKNLEFTYPSRANVKVLKGVSLQVHRGQTIALVGQSGCGKSTIMSLLQRFYDSDAGSISIDGVDIRSMNINFLRSCISVVSQEPVLFNCNIRDNIAYGVERDVEMSEIIEVARTANIHDFITSLPQGYDTVVGEKGTQLSGGQKQRVAIARALLCNPVILLLDEATSALDTESEKVVQAALDRAREGRTCIMIAHRLSTVQNADIIAVLDNGTVVEQGSHQELLAKKGAYHTLASGQLSLV